MWAEVWQWFLETDDLMMTAWEHVRLSFTPVLAAIALVLPIGVYIGHRRRFEVLAVTMANVGRAIPTFGVLALLLPLSIRFGFGLGFWPTVAALFLLSLPPILTNTYTGVKEVDPEVVESARGMGLTELQVVRDVELPLALPLIVAGIRIATLQSVATAGLAALVAGGGFGKYIFLGIRASKDGPLIGGALLIALLAIATEIGFALLLRRAARDRAGAWAVPGGPAEPGQVGRAGGMA